jgi:hypothetical protein
MSSHCDIYAGLDRGWYQLMWHLFPGEKSAQAGLAAALLARDDGIYSLLLTVQAIRGRNPACYGPLLTSFRGSSVDLWGKFNGLRRMPAGYIAMALDAYRLRRV